MSDQFILVLLGSEMFECISHYISQWIKRENFEKTEKRKAVVGFKQSVSRLHQNQNQLYTITLCFSSCLFSIVACCCSTVISQLGINKVHLSIYVLAMYLQNMQELGL